MASRDKEILVTGAAGFIGYHVASRMLREGKKVLGLDNLNAYYDTNLKKRRLAELERLPGFRFIKQDISDREGISHLFREGSFDLVLHLAAQAGVRYSLVNPYAYAESNLHGFLNILEGCRHSRVKHLVFASSSSVYGANTKLPFTVQDRVDHPISLYGATKKANELMAYSYATLYHLSCTGLRFFTVYGPWGRPDMALFIFTKAILEGRPIDIFNHGRMKRDFTYIDDIVDGVVRVLEGSPPELKETSGRAPYRIYNIGNNQPIELLTFVGILEEMLGKKAEKRFLPMQPGDVPETYADVDDLMNDFGFRPKTPIREGMKKFVSWYREFYNV